MYIHQNAPACKLSILLEPYLPELCIALHALLPSANENSRYIHTSHSWALSRKLPKGLPGCPYLMLKLDLEETDSIYSWKLYCQHKHFFPDLSGDLRRLWWCFVTDMSERVTVPVLFTSIRGIYSPCLSIKLPDLSQANLTHGTKKLPTWTLERIRNGTISDWATLK